MDRPAPQRFERKPTSVGEWITIALIVVIIVLGFLLIWFIFFPQLFQSKAFSIPAFQTPKGCPVSNAPTGLAATQINTTKPNVDLSWNAVLTPNTSGETILGYNIYSSTTPGISDSNKQKAAFTVVPEKRLFSTAQGPVKAGTTYYFTVTTVDSCGESGLSSEVSFTPS